MKIKSKWGKGNWRCRSGIQLVEGMVYMALYLVIVGFAFTAFFKLLTVQRDLQRNSEVLIQGLRAGEKWREDVRLAVGLPEVQELDAGVRFRIVQAEREVWYWFDGTGVWRRAGEEQGAMVLGGVEVSEMGEERREEVTAMRWEVRMKAKKKVVRVTPEFTFYAVPLARLNSEEL